MVEYEDMDWINLSQVAGSCEYGNEFRVPEMAGIS